MARDRKRAKQRQQRRSAQTRATQRVGPKGEAFEAPPDPIEDAAPQAELARAAEDPELAPVGDLDPDELPQPDELAGAPDEEELAATPGRPRPTQHEPRRGGTRFGNFLRACWAELKRVQWPDRRQVAQATGVVIAFVVIAGLYLGLADVVASHVVDFILNKL
jgi:preprotein translocase subunit SecE